MTEDNFRAVIVCGGAAWFFLSLSVIAVILFIARYKLEYMEGFLKSARWIARVHGNFGLNNWLSRLYRLNILNMVLFFPKTYARRGEINLDELYAIPSSLRYMVKAAHWFMILSFMLLMLSYFFIKCYRPI